MSNSISGNGSDASTWARARDLFSEYAVCSFPVLDIPPDVQESLDPWFLQFTGKSSHDVRALLRQQWELLQLAELREVASFLLKHTPLGILHSKKPDWNESWLMFGRFSLSNKDIHAYAAAAAQKPMDLCWTLDLPVEYYLPAPTTLPPELQAKIGADDLLIHFFMTFGGLMLGAPYEATMRFHKFPKPQMDELLGDADPIIGTGWEEAKELFVNSTGDRLLISPEGRIAWLRHEDRAIRVVAMTFSELLRKFAETGYWKEPYDDDPIL